MLTTIHHMQRRRGLQRRRLLGATRAVVVAATGAAYAGGRAVRGGRFLGGAQCGRGRCRAQDIQADSDGAASGREGRASAAACATIAGASATFAVVASNGAARGDAICIIGAIRIIGAIIQRPAASQHCASAAASATIGGSSATFAVAASNGAARGDASCIIQSTFEVAASNGAARGDASGIIGPIVFASATHLCSIEEPRNQFGCLFWSRNFRGSHPCCRSKRTMPAFLHRKPARA